MVSVSISLPSRGAFHLSLTVLVHYRSLDVFSFGQWSAQIPTMETFLVVLEDSDRRVSAYVYWTITVCGVPFQAPSTNGHFSDFVAEQQLDYRASQPATRNACRLSRASRLSYSRFARHY